MHFAFASSFDSHLLLGAAHWKLDGFAAYITNSCNCEMQVLGEALLASGYIAYMGPLPGSYREQVLDACPARLYSQELGMLEVKAAQSMLFDAVAQPTLARSKESSDCSL